MSSKKVLFVDDEEIERKKIDRIFKEHNSNADLVMIDNAISALDYLNDNVKSLPDLIILDINMPLMDGFAFLKLLKGKDEFTHLPIIILSTSSNPTDIEKSNQFSTSGYFVKPLNYDEYKRQMFVILDYWLLNQMN